MLPSPTSNQYVFRMNWLQPPFNNAKIRQAVAYALSQEEFLQANIGDKRFYRVVQGDVHLRHAARHRRPAWTG